MATLRAYRLRPDRIGNIRIVARTLNLHRINGSHEEALCRIRWWQSWGFDPFEPVDEMDWRTMQVINPGVEIDLPIDYQDLVDQALQVGEPGYTMMSQGVVRATEEVSFEQEYLNEWLPYATERHTEAIQQARVYRASFPQPLTVQAGQQLQVEWNFPINGEPTVNGRVIDDDGPWWRGSPEFQLIEDM